MVQQGAERPALAGLVREAVEFPSRRREQLPERARQFAMRRRERRVPMIGPGWFLVVAQELAAGDAVRIAPTPAPLDLERLLRPFAYSEPHRIRTDPPRGPDNGKNCSTGVNEDRRLRPEQRQGMIAVGFGGARRERRLAGRCDAAKPPTAPAMGMEAGPRLGLPRLGTQYDSPARRDRSDRGGRPGCVLPAAEPGCGPGATKDG